MIVDGGRAWQVCASCLWAVSASSACIWEELDFRKVYLLWTFACAAVGRKGTAPCAC